MTTTQQAVEKTKEIENLVIEIGANGGRFLGEHGMVFQPIIDEYVERIKALVTNSQEKV